MKYLENICNKLAEDAMYDIFARTRLENEFHSRFIEGLDTNQVIRELETVNNQLAFTYNRFKEL